MILILIALGLGLGVGNPESWKWIDVFGTYAVQGLAFLILSKPWSIIICFALALTLFMTRLKY